MTGSSAPAAAPAIKGGAEQAVEDWESHQVASPQNTGVDERLVFTAAVLVGYTVQVQTTAGLVYEGVFHGIAPLSNGCMDVQLKMARLVADPSVPPAQFRMQRPTPTLTIPWADFAALTAADVRMGEGDVGPVAWDDAGGFGTDAAISRSRGAFGRERQLQRWAPEVGEEQMMMGLEESAGPVERGWDQFALNEAKFGVKTDFREELYTTQLDPTKSRISLAEANRIAAEIERGDTTNVHLLEERGRVIDDSQLDEEDRYGAVVRQPPAPATNGAAPAAAPAQRPAGAWGRGGLPGAARPLFVPSAPGAAPPPTAAMPIPIDPRREANKLRAQLSAGKKTSPYGTPKSAKSPLQSPLISDAAKLEALNLNPGSGPVVDAETRAQFQAFKAQQQAAASAFKREDISQYRQFSQQLESKLSKSLSAESKAMAAAAALTAGTSTAPTAAAAAPAASARGAAAAAATGKAAAPAAAEKPAAPAEGGVASAGGKAAAEGEKGAGEAAPKKSFTSSLNPNAKSFTFNLAAKEFVPGQPVAPAAALQSAPVAAVAPAAAAAPRPAGLAGSPGASTGQVGGAMSSPQFGSSSIPLPGGFKGPGGPGGPAGRMSTGPGDFRGPRMGSRELDAAAHRGVGSFERDSGSYGRRRDEREFDGRRREGRQYEAGPGMRGGPGGVEGGMHPPPPPGKAGPGGPMQMVPPQMVFVGPGGPQMMVPAQQMGVMPGGMVVGPGGQPMMAVPGGQPGMMMMRPGFPPQMFMMAPGPGMMPGGPQMMAMQPGMPQAVGSPGGRPAMGPAAGMGMPMGPMGPGMMQPGGGGMMDGRPDGDGA